MIPTEVTPAILNDISREAGVARETVLRRMLGWPGKGRIQARVEQACAKRGIVLPPRVAATFPQRKPTP